MSKKKTLGNVVTNSRLRNAFRIFSLIVLEISRIFEKIAKFPILPPSLRGHQA